MFITVSGITALVTVAINVAALAYVGRVTYRYTGKKVDELSRWYKTIQKEYADRTTSVEPFPTAESKKSPESRVSTQIIHGKGSSS